MNNDVPELSGKGITKAMIDCIRKNYNVVIVSSANIENQQIDETEGRINYVTKYWEKWMTENPKIEYNTTEGRFFYFL